MKHKIIIILVIAVFLVFGCSSLSKDQAEKTALNFINSNVKFFAKDQEENKDLAQYNIEDMTSYKDGKDWVVIAHISADLKDEEKSNDISIKLNNKGQVVEFNGRKVPIINN